VAVRAARDDAVNANGNGYNWRTGAGNYASGEQ
jgi:hypothetical protein